MSRPNYQIAYRHTYFASNRVKASGEDRLNPSSWEFDNPTQAQDRYQQFLVNDVEFDYTFYNCRAPYNQFSIVTGTNAPVVMTIPEGNYSITELYSAAMDQMALNALSIGLVCTQLSLKPNSNHCYFVLAKTGDYTGVTTYDPKVYLSFKNETASTTGIKGDKYGSFSSILRWAFGMQFRGGDDIETDGAPTGHFVKSYNSVTNQTLWTFESLLVPQAVFDSYVYFTSDYLNSFDSSTYENVPTEDDALYGKAIQNIFIKIPTSQYNFGDRVWMTVATPFDWDPIASNQKVDIQICDMFGRQLNLNGGNFAISNTMLQTRDPIVTSR